MQNWFSRSVRENEVQQKASSSLLAEWNSYAATRSTDKSSGGGSLVGVFDIESVVKSAKDTVSGTFSVHKDEN